MNRQSRLHFFYFWGLLLLVMTAFGYWQIQSYGPASLHSWRQADGAAQAFRYYLDGMHFWQPATFHALPHNDGQAVAEFPLLYYVSAAIFHLTGPSSAVLRWVHFGIFAGGLFAFSRFLLERWGSLFHSIFLPFLLLGSPVVAFYAFNFIPNPPALGYGLLAVYAWWRYRRQQQISWYWGAILLLLLCGLIKPTLLVPYGVWGVLGTLAQFRTRAPYARYFPRGLAWWAGQLLVAGGGLAWIYWANAYNEAHRSPIFLTQLAPIWSMTSERITYTWNYIHTYNYVRYFPRLILVLTGFLLIWSLFRSLYRPAWRGWLLWGGVLAGGSVFLLFFRQFLTHSYYFIDLLPLVLLTWVWAWHGWQRDRRSLFDSPWVHGGLGILLIGSLWYAKTHLDTQYSKHGELQYFQPDFQHPAPLRAFVDSLGIDYDRDRVVIIGDRSANEALYYLGRKGTTVAYRPFIRASTVRVLAEKGYHYAVVVGTPPARDSLDQVLTDPIGVYGDSIRVYRTAPVD